MTATGGTADTVLLLHSDPPFRQILASSTRREGFQVIDVPDVVSAIRCLQAMPGGIDWLIVDLDAPGPCRVVHVIHEYRFFHPLRPVVATTGLAIPDAARRTTELTVFRHDDGVLARVVSYLNELRRLKAELTY